MIENTVKLGMKINYRKKNSPTLTEDVYETLMYRKEIANDIIKENSGHNQGNRQRRTSSGRRKRKILSPLHVQNNIFIGMLMNHSDFISRLKAILFQIQNKCIPFSCQTWL